jgi:SAM-dependent methyltransferase
MRKVLQTYRSLCAEYYDLHKPVLPDDEWQFYLKYAQEAEGILLEPMCGTGHFLIPLMQEGFVIEGFDASESMLARLVERSDPMGLVPQVWLGFLEDLALKNRYALAFIPVGSFNLIDDLDAVKMSLKALYDSLLPDGVLVLEVITHQLAQKIESDVWLSDLYDRADGSALAVDSFYHPMKEGVVRVERRYVVRDRQGKTVQQETEEHTLRFYTPGEMGAILKDAGFATVKMVKAFEHGTLPGPEDVLVIYECKK